MPTGFQSKELIVKAGLNLGDVDQFPNIDVTIDGADEVDVSCGFVVGARREERRKGADARSRALSAKQGDLVPQREARRLSRQFLTFLLIRRTISMQSSTSRDSSIPQALLTYRLNR